MPGYDNELALIVAELNRAALGTRASHGDTPQSTASLDQLLAYAAERHASDLLLIAGASVALRIDGVLSLAAGPPLGAEDTRNLLLPLLTAKQAQELQQSKSTDFCFSREAIGRFRANVHHQRGTLAGSIRLLPARIPTLESLHCRRRCAAGRARQGLILMTGATGCGKSSTLAALIDIDQCRAARSHRHHRRSGGVSARAIATRSWSRSSGHDTPSFAQAVRSICGRTPT